MRESHEALEFRRAAAMGGGGASKGGEGKLAYSGLGRLVVEALLPRWKGRKAGVSFSEKEGGPRR